MAVTRENFQSDKYNWYECGFLEYLNACWFYYWYWYLVKGNNPCRGQRCSRKGKRQISKPIKIKKACNLPRVAFGVRQTIPHMTLHIPFCARNPKRKTQSHALSELHVHVAVPTEAPHTSEALREELRESSTQKTTKKGNDKICQRTVTT